MHHTTRPFKISPTVRRSEFPLDKLMQLVSHEETITAQLLRIANSPLYGRARPAESIKPPSSPWAFNASKTSCSAVASASSYLQING
jgi:hypothetical protein